MLLTTTPTLENRTIREYRGIVTGEAIMGANLFKDFFATIRDLVGGRSATYEKEFRHARQVAFQELEEEARRLNADAVVGINLEYQVLGKSRGMLMVSASGTAVITG